jgi:hypothetical protein
MEINHTHVYEYYGNTVSKSNNIKDGDNKFNMKLFAENKKTKRNNTNK